MDGYQFEYQCAAILKRKHFSKIEVTKSSGDQGVDIIAYKHRKKYGIQCKYYTYPVGNKAVQEAYAGANFYDCDKAMVMTNTTFTRSATELAEKLEVELWANCPTSRYYSVPFKLMGLINIVLFIYGILELLSPQYSFIQLPFTVDHVTLGIILAASVFGLVGWRLMLCNLVAAGAYLYLALHLILLPAINNSGYTDWQLLALIPAIAYLLHACYLIRKK
nr:restriction endonuclease [uncultured Mediterraneibacter sp.]